MIFSMRVSLLVVSALLAGLSMVSAHHQHVSLHRDTGHGVQAHMKEDVDPVPYETRVYWMRRARAALLELTGSPCPFGAFGTAIVNHTGRGQNELGELVCLGVNRVGEVGNPTLHGEIAGINNCTTVLASAPYNLSPSGILAAWKDLSLYTTAEPCPMCATAISWAAFREFIYATGIQTLLDFGWTQTNIGSQEVIARGPLAGKMGIIGGVLANETDELFGWQFQKGTCPSGCVEKDNEGCVARDN